MAYNNGFPMSYQQYYQPMGYQQQMNVQQQNQQMMTPPTIHAEIVQIARDEEEFLVVHAVSHRSINIEAFQAKSADKTAFYLNRQKRR